jgi:hypothetical protein
MSYFGPAVLARCAQRLRDLESVAGIDSFGDVDEEAYADGWRLGYVPSPDYHDPAELARQLVDETGAPAIALYINDGAYANASCCSPQGITCEFYLDEQAFREYCSDFGEEDLTGLRLQRDEAVIDVLVRWANEAGLAADPEHLTAALIASPGQPDDSVHRLVDALGIRGT